SITTSNRQSRSSNYNKTDRGRVIMVKPNDPYLTNILEGEKITVDDTTEYQESTLEKQEEFARKRNYEWDEWKPIE
ncbi:hypothetical protein JZU68_04295, partial [bacterium]|nr:hypothetical protein [bacterium]